MGLRATTRLTVPLDEAVRPADLVQLCPGCEARLDEAQAARHFAILNCPGCGLSVMTPRDRRRERRP
jgi:hypothetical protein